MRTFGANLNAFDLRRPWDTTNGICMNNDRLMNALSDL